MASPALPGFGLDDYRELLVALRGNGYSLLPVSRMADAEAGSAYLRHDIDIHLLGVEAMAEVEAACGARATYYVCLTQPYNPLTLEGRRVMARLRELGHEIGLHYDLETYPAGAAERRAHLDWELEVLGRAAGAPIRTLCMHQPFRGEPDPFRELEGLLHPHDPGLQEGLLYVSDSCRAWRDTSLLRCTGDDPPARLLLNAHPELWLDGSCPDRVAYLETVLLPNAAREVTAFVNGTVREVWCTHSAPLAHDARARGAATAGAEAS